MLEKVHYLSMGVANGVMKEALGQKRFWTDSNLESVGPALREGTEGTCIKSLA